MTQCNVDAQDRFQRTVLDFNLFFITYTLWIIRINKTYLVKYMAEKLINTENTSFLGGND